jgi:hypothetical protein
MIWRIIKNFLTYLHKTIKKPTTKPEERILVTLPQLPYDPMEPFEAQAKERQMISWGLTETTTYKI